MKKCKAVFLDRDGVINDNTNFTNTPEDLIIYPWVFKAIKKLNEAGYKVFIVTNQGGIESGFLKEETLKEIHDKLLHCMKENNAIIDDIEYCPHYKTECDCRKPKPGMINKLIEKYNIDTDKSWMIGDSHADIKAGKAAGLNSIFIGNDYYVNLNANGWFKNLIEAIKFILKED